MASATSRAGCATPSAIRAARCAPCPTSGARRCCWRAARSSATQPPTSLRSLFARRGAARAALPDSPLELALAARYLGIGNPFALARDELVAAREVARAGPAAAAPLLERVRAALALPPRADRPRARQRRDARRPARGRRARCCRARARSRPSGCSASSRARPRAVCARRVAGALLAPVLAGAARCGARAALGARGDLRGALGRRLQDAPAGALEHAREQRRGRPAGGRGRASRAGRSGWVNGCCCASGDDSFCRCRVVRELLGSIRCSPRAATCEPSTGLADVAATSLSSRSVRWASALAWLRLPKRTRVGDTQCRGKPRLGADPDRRAAPRRRDRALQRRQVPPRADDEPDPPERGASLDRARQPQRRRGTRSTSRSSAPTRTRSPIRCRPRSGAQLRPGAGAVRAARPRADRTTRASSATSATTARTSTRASACSTTSATRAATPSPSSPSLKSADQRLDRLRQAALPRSQGQGAAAHRGAQAGRDRGLAARRRARAPAAGGLDHAGRSPSTTSAA